MKRELLILRHGKSDWDVACDDFQRPLKDRGKRGAQRMGAWLWREGRIADLIITSPAERALVTAEKCCKAMGLGAAGIIEKRRIYDAGAGDLMHVLNESPAEAQRILLVGHNPGLEELVEYLADVQPAIPADGKLMPTATLAIFSVAEEWSALSAGGGHLEEIVRPNQLPKKFPFPAPDGPESRDRPAYYYSQSSVIPYRRVEGRLEILVIASSKNKHWVVPKGIIDPGLSPQESAKKEALEEAGAEGEPTAEALGDYRYEKWGATCTVSVYPMAVSRLLPADEWEEEHRGRGWVSPEEAMKRVKQQELVPMIRQLAEQ